MQNHAKKTGNWWLITEHDGDFLVGFGKWVRNIVLREDDKGSIDRNSKP